MQSDEKKKPGTVHKKMDGGVTKSEAYQCVKARWMKLDESPDTHAADWQRSECENRLLALDGQPVAVLGKVVFNIGQLNGPVPMQVPEAGMGLFVINDLNDLSETLRAAVEL